MTPYSSLTTDAVVAVVPPGFSSYGNRSEYHLPWTAGLGHPTLIRQDRLQALQSRRLILAAMGLFASVGAFFRVWGDSSRGVSSTKVFFHEKIVFCS